MEKRLLLKSGASLQIAKIGAGSIDEAANNNFKSFSYSKFFARDTPETVC
ncbi:hypothetical protein O5282_26985 [Escherichia coli]|nr:hypothetical protein [Escherichia coli]